MYSKIYQYIYIYMINIKHILYYNIFYYDMYKHNWTSKRGGQTRRSASCLNLNITCEEKLSSIISTGICRHA